MNQSPSYSKLASRPAPAREPANGAGRGHPMSKGETLQAFRPEGSRRNTRNWVYPLLAPLIGIRGSEASRDWSNPYVLERLVQAWKAGGRWEEQD